MMFVLQVVHRVSTLHLLGQAGLKPDEADIGVVTLIQRFGSAANLNVHLDCPMLDGGYRRPADGALEFIEARASTAPALQAALQAALHKIIIRTMKMLTHRRLLVEEEGSTYLTDNYGDSNEALRPAPSGN